MKIGDWVAGSVVAHRVEEIKNLAGCSPPSVTTRYACGHYDWHHASVRPDNEQQHCQECEAA